MEIKDIESEFKNKPSEPEVHSAPKQAKFCIYSVETPENEKAKLWMNSSLTEPKNSENRIRRQGLMEKITLGIKLPEKNNFSKISENEKLAKYWSIYLDRYPGMPHDYLKVLSHPDVTYDDKEFLEKQAAKIPSKVFKCQLVGLSTILYLHYGTKLTKKKFKKNLFFSIGIFTLIPISILFTSYQFCHYSLDKKCSETGLSDKYNIKIMNKELKN